MRARPFLSALFLIALFAACDSPIALQQDPVVGSYVATTFTMNQGGSTIDWLARGASLHITLASDRTTTGRLFVPGAEKDGSDLDADLTGTWSRTGTTVRFSHAADTFIRDAEFQVSPGRLVGGYGPVQVVLEKQ